MTTIDLKTSEATEQTGGTVELGVKESSFGKGQLKRIKHGRAHMERERDKTEQAWKLCSHYRSSTQEIDLKKFEDFDTKQIDELWKEVKAYLPAGSSKIWIDLGDLYIRYTDSAGKIHYLDVSKTNGGTPEKLINLMHKVRNVAQKVWIDLKLGHNFNDEANRAAGALKPLQIPTDDWKGKMPKNIELFVKDGHFEQLVKVSGLKEEDVLNSIMAAESYLQKLKEAAQDKKKELEEALRDAGFHTRPVAEQKETKRSIDQLTQFISEIDELDRLPLYYAVGIWGDTDASTISKEKRFELAGLIAEGVESTLMRSLKPGVDDRNLVLKKMGIGDKIANAILGAGPFIKTYAGDAGDLVIPEKLDYIQRVSEDGREARAPTLIEFVTQAMIQGDRFDTDQAFARLKLGYTEEVNGTLIQGAKDARQEAEETDVGEYTIKKNKLKFTSPSMQNLAAGAA